MYAIIRAGGKQYKVQAGDTVRVEKLEKKLGDEFDVSEVLFVGGDKAFVGEPLVQNAKVRVVVTRQAKSPKVIVFKKKRRQGYRKMQGHRQLFTELFVKSITNPEGAKSETEKSIIVVDPAKIQARKEAFAAAQTKESKAAKREKRASDAAAPKKAAKKKTAKKVAGAKKSAAKKTAGKKKAAGKKTAKK
ncbi:MAG: 50S ribosomal protein L21 [Bdellovibrionaceae bacterium]|nr:50S ribosomal protein L21 [Pseudobdellovibrionaceae bacterium]